MTAIISTNRSRMVMTAITITLVAIAIFLAVSRRFAPIAPATVPTPTGNILNIIADREHLIDTEIVAIGYGRCQFEGKAIYQDLSAMHKLDFRRALWIKINDKHRFWQTFKNNDGKLIEIRGRLNLRETGHGGLYAGSIEDIKLVVPK